MRRGRDSVEGQTNQQTEQVASVLSFSVGGQQQEEDNVVEGDLDAALRMSMEISCRYCCR